MERGSKAVAPAEHGITSNVNISCVVRGLATWGELPGGCVVALYHYLPEGATWDAGSASTKEQMAKQFTYHVDGYLGRNA